jgi:tyrosyl-tRNA synthetase
MILLSSIVCLIVRCRSVASDQWGNITGGIDLARRLNQRQVFGLTLPLVTKADGSKFGKTEDGTIWLDPAKTSCYAFYQFWINTADADVYKFLRYYTFMDVAEIDALEARDRLSDAKPEAQSVLAREVTRLVHGEDGLQAAMRISEALFADDPAALTEEDFGQLKMDGLPSSSCDKDEVSLVEILVSCGLAKSNRVAREFIANGAISVNGQRQTMEDTLLSKSMALYGQFFLIKRGKKIFHLVYRQH